MSRNLLRCLLPLLLVALPITASASSKMFEGVLVEVGKTDAKTGRTMITIRGVDHYHSEYECIDRPFHISPHAQYVLDGRIVPRDIALQPGRRCFAYGSNGGLKYVVVLSAEVFSPAGTLTARDGRRLDLALPLATTVLPWPVELAEDAELPAQDAEAALTPGAWIRVSPGRPQILALLSPEAQKRRIHGLGRACEAVFLPPAPEARWTLRLHKDGGDETLSFGKGGKPPQTVVDALFWKGTPVPDTAGRPAVLVEMVHGDGRPDGQALVLVSDLTGRTQGRITAIQGQTLTVAVWNGEQEVITTLDLAPAARISPGWESRPTVRPDGGPDGAGPGGASATPGTHRTLQAADE